LVAIKRNAAFILITVIVAVAVTSLVILRTTISQGTPRSTSAAVPSSPTSRNINYTQQQQFIPAQGNINTTRVVKVAFVRPSFTYAAYELNGFYNFYAKYGHVTPGTNITTDLNLLTVKIPYGNYLTHNQSPTDIPSTPREKAYIAILGQHVKERAPISDINISNITDKEVNEGLIFTNATNNNYNIIGSNSSHQNKTNAYDILFLFHQEYVTAAEYENLKQFVANGGTIVFNDANIFTTEVSYDKSNDTVTLIEGHGWKYDRQSGVAWPAEKERWEAENREWVGSNFLQDPTKDNVTFANNPFGYRHIEEQYVTNPNDTIILNFGAEVHNEPYKVIRNGGVRDHPTVAIYELNYGKGKIISLSIFSYKLLDNTSFLDYYDKVIIPRAFSSIAAVGGEATALVA
jgi:N,N-dimethylformamidase beta subunit-like protein